MFLKGGGGNFLLLSMLFDFLRTSFTRKSGQSVHRILTGYIIRLVQGRGRSLALERVFFMSYVEMGAVLWGSLVLAESLTRCQQRLQARRDWRR
jgi:hypothetical protein